ncbi:MAG: hypothetical protein PVG55_02975 [Nitrospirota bacterium]|jgi:hypothetical protein
MIEKIKSSLDSGVGKIKGFANLFSDRLKVEASVIKLMKESGGLEKEKEAHFRTIGERVFELRGGGEVNVFEDIVIRQTLDRIEKLDAEIAEIKKRASEISKVE